MTQREAIELVTDAIEAMPETRRTRPGDAATQAERVRLEANDLRLAVDRRTRASVQKQLAANAAAEAVLFLVHHVDE